MGFVQPKVKGYKQLFSLIFLGSFGGQKQAAAMARKIESKGGAQRPLAGRSEACFGAVLAGGVRG